MQHLVLAPLREFFTLSKVRFCASFNHGDIGKNVSRVYQPLVAEEAVRERWKRQKDTNPNLNGRSFQDEDVFRMILPPPNVTGKLHLGHALTVAIQDSIMRWKLMSGSAIKWIPGFDHAGIATQSVVVRKLEAQMSPKTEKSGRSVVNIDPGLLQSQLREFSDLSRGRISSQLEKIGTLLDWESGYYTMDESHNSVVEEAFITLFESGLIRRGDGMVNWSSVLRSSVADVECVPAPFDGKMTLRVPGMKQLVEFGRLYFVSYKLEDGGDSILVATSRPETIFGDVAVAVNPDDDRFGRFVGKRVVNPLTGQHIPVIADRRVKIDFGSGALKVTPAHDKTDFKIGVDHNLERLNIFTTDGRLNEKCGDVSGLHRFAGRKAVIKRLKESGALTDIKDYKGTVDLCSRTGDVIEPRILPHWFFQTETLSNKIKSLVNNNELRIEPEYQQSNFLFTLSNAHDWCLSRQIRWGHAIPAYFHVNHPDVWVAAFDKESALKKLEKALSCSIESVDDVRQDEDVLDTWFSSALIPLSVSGWPDIDGKNYKELALMETGNDILVFWVWRMVMLNLALVDRLPFRHVVLHGLITDPYGRKMSKSRGNVVDPLHIIEGRTFEELMREAEESYSSGELDENEYKLRLAGLKKYYPTGFSVCGADALRFVLLSQDLHKHDIKLDTVYLENCRHFMNKIWQAMRFYFTHAEKGIHHPTQITKPDTKIANTLPDRWILACLYEFCLKMENSIPACQFHESVEATRNFFYGQFCDVYIELIKSELKDGINAETRILVMRYIFGTGMKLIHPFMPFLSEEMWHHITQDDCGLLRDAKYPKSEELLEFKNDQLIEDMATGIKIASEIRSLRTKAGISKKSTAAVHLELGPQDSDFAHIIPAIESITSSQIILEPPLRTSRPNVITHSVDLREGKSCRLSILQDGSSKTSPTVTAAEGSIKNLDKVMKLQAKLENLKDKLEDPEFLKFADEHSKNDLKKKMEQIRTKIEEINEGASSTKHR